MSSAWNAKGALTRCWIVMAAFALPGVAVAASAQPTQAEVAAVSAETTSDDALVATLPGFRRGFAEVNGVRLHYVAGGSGDAIVLLPGWPQTWWAYHKIMPELARRHRVIAVDIRGMGASDRPAGGYDKRTMAADIRALVRQLGLGRPHIVGHDIGAMVAFSYAANYPDATRSLTMLDVPHPDDGLATWPMLPKHGTFTDRLDPANPYPWWFAFHQVRGLPEQLLEGRAHLEQEWFFRYLLVNDAALDARDRAVYARAYNSRDAIRAGTAWYQAFTQDIVDARSYARLRMPVLGISGTGSYAWLKSNLEQTTTDPRIVLLENSGHFVAEEQPQQTLRHMLEFIGGLGRAPGQPRR